MRSRKTLLLVATTLLVAACNPKQANNADTTAPVKSKPYEEKVAMEDNDDDKMMEEDKMEEEHMEEERMEKEMEVEPEVDVVEQEEEEEPVAMEEKEEVIAFGATYTDYRDGVIGNGESSVLFFAAAWCPSCRTNDERLRGWLAADALTRPVYKIDYDTADNLKTQFGVVQQDTFVLIDGAGNIVKTVSFPSEGALRSLVQG